MDDAAVVDAGYDPADVGPDEHYYRLTQCPPTYITFPGVSGRHNFISTWESGQVIHTDWCLDS